MSVADVVTCILVHNNFQNQFPDTMTTITTKCSVSSIREPDDMRVQDVSIDISIDESIEAIDEIQTKSRLNYPFTPNIPRIECVMDSSFTLNKAIVRNEECSTIDSCSTCSPCMFTCNINEQMMSRTFIKADDKHTVAVSLDSCIQHQIKSVTPATKSDIIYLGADFDVPAPTGPPMLPAFSDDDDTDDEILMEYNRRVPSLKMRRVSRRPEF
jgi:hypothetical protein